MNIENLLKLARQLERPLPSGYIFDMESYRELKPCGTVCCALGYAPVVKGLEPTDDEMDSYEDIDFEGKYSRRVFGMDVDECEWLWCFGGEWADIDNTKTGAAKRIRWLVNHGLPENWKSQLNGVDELCYK